MKGTRLATIVVALLAIVAAIAWRSFGGGDAGPGELKSDRDVVLRFAYSPEKEGLLAPLVEQFNEKGERVGGRKIVVQPTVISSGEATTRIASGRLQPDLWSPASSAWGRLLNFEWIGAPKPPVADQNPSLVQSPVVVAMWEPLARALGWPNKEIGWSDILTAAKDPQGWAAKGHPEWGRFKLGHTNPDFSTSGLAAVTAEYLTAIDSREGLRLADVRRTDVRAAVRAIEQSIVHYGATDAFFVERMSRFGIAYASAVALQETTLLAFNTGDGAARARYKLAAIYPREGTFMNDHPLITVDQAWVKPAEREAAAKLTDFLLKEVTADRAGQFGFRPADPAAPARGKVATANLVDPRKPTALLRYPEAKVIELIRRGWRSDRKPARIQLVLDVSTSMLDDGKIDQAKAGLVAFLGRLEPQDEVGLSVFSSGVTDLVEPGRIDRNYNALVRTIKNVLAEGNTAVYDATNGAVRKLEPGAGPERISAVVLLTDGDDNSSSVTLAQLLKTLDRNVEDESKVVRVFTIAYGAEARREVLNRIAVAGRGQSYAGNPDNIAAVYTQIASFF